MEMNLSIDVTNYVPKDEKVPIVVHQNETKILKRSKRTAACPLDTLEVYYNRSKIASMACPYCPPGQGFSPECGSRVTNGTVYKCRSCIEALTISDEFDFAPCKSCPLCGEGRIILGECELKARRICSQFCQSGYTLVLEYGPNNTHCIWHTNRTLILRTQTQMFTERTNINVTISPTSKDNKEYAVVGVIIYLGIIVAMMLIPACNISIMLRCRRLPSWQSGK